MTEKTHAKFGSPSSLARHEQCPGNVAYCRDLPKPEESEYAKEGTIFHEYMEKCLPLYLKGKPREALKLTRGYEHADVVLSTLQTMNLKWERFRERHAKCSYSVERRIAVSEDCFGTADVVFVGYNIKSKKTDVVVTDYKFGQGVAVQAEKNLQGIAYLLGAVNSEKISPEELGVAMIIIAQVRLEDGWSSFSLKSDELFDYELDILETVAKVKALYENPVGLEKHLHAGRYCRFCPADGICVAQRAAHQDLIVQPEELPIEERVKTLTLDEQVAIFLRKGAVEDFLNAVATNLTRAFEAGVTHDALKLVRTRGRRSWLEDEAKVAKGLKKLGVTDPWKKSLRGLTEIEKEIGKGKIDDLVQLGSGKLELVPASDSRPAAELTTAEELPE